MNIRRTKFFAALLTTWQRLTASDRHALITLSVVMVAALAFVGIWQPAKERLINAERAYQQRLVLANEISRAQPAGTKIDNTQPLSVRLSDRATADGLDLQQLEIQEDTLRLTLNGNAPALLDWIHRAELDGAQVQSLTLDKQQQQLHAELVIRAPDGA